MTEILEREVRAEDLDPASFWPRFASTGDQQITEPDLAFRCEDEDADSASWVIIEAKPLYKQHAAAQLAREVIDTVRATNADHVDLIMVGADLGPPAERKEWEDRIKYELGESQFPDVRAALTYSSWARLGAHVERCGKTAPAWRRYAEDVLTHLQSKGLLGYKGAAVFDGLEKMSTPNVVEGFNRVVLAARQFLLALHGDSRFQMMGFTPPGSRGFEMLSDATSSVLTQHPDWFTTSTLLSPYTHASSKPGHGAFSGFFFDDSAAYVVAGAFTASAQGLFAVSFGESEERKRDELVDRALRDTVAPVLDQASAGRQYEFRFGMREWGVGPPEEDIAWSLDCLQAAVTIGTADQ